MQRLAGGVTPRDATTAQHVLSNPPESRERCRVVFGMLLVVARYAAKGRYGEVAVDTEIERLGSWRERAHDPALTTLLAVQCFVLLIAAPAAATGHLSGRIALQLAVLALAVVVFVISH